MKNKTTSKLSIILNIILLLFFIVYFCVPFSATGFWSKAFSPLCTIQGAFQGQDFLPGWCVLQQGADMSEINDNTNNNINDNNNLNTNENINAVGIANPAATKCVADGGQTEIYTAMDGGQKALCIFSDQSVCEEWAYFRGECKKGECQKVCKAINTKNEGWYNSCTGELIKAEICSTDNDGSDIKDNINAPISGNDTGSNLNTNITNTKPVATSSAITLISPVADEQLISPLTVSGKAKTPDNKIYVRVKSKTGQPLINVEGTVRNIGTDGIGDFSLKLSYEFSTTKEGFIDVFAKDGDKEIDVVSIPVKF